MSLTLFPLSYISCIYAGGLAFDYYTAYLLTAFSYAQTTPLFSNQQALFMVSKNTSMSQNFCEFLSPAPGGVTCVSRTVTRVSPTMID